MRVMGLLGLLGLLLGGCGETAPVVRPIPIWFALGSEVPDYADARAMQSTALAIRPEPRWFSGLPRRATPADLAARHVAGEHILEAVASEDVGGPRWIPTVLALPPKLQDLALSDQGAVLDLEARVLPQSSDIELRLELRASLRPVWREVEHRWTNTVPFLIGIYADGRTVHRRSSGSAKCGGTQSFVKLVESGCSRQWVLRVKRESVTRLLAEQPARILGFVAVFSERQHSEHAVHGGALPSPARLNPPFERQILVRSRIAAIRWAP